MKAAVFVGSGGSKNLFGLGDIPIFGTGYDIGYGVINNFDKLADPNTPVNEKITAGIHIITFAITVGSLGEGGGMLPSLGDPKSSIPRPILFKRTLMTSPRMPRIR